MGTRIFLLLLLSPAALGLMVARCPEGWTAYGGTDQCYRVHSYGRDRTFEDARIYCQARGGDLAYIDDPDLRDWLGQLVAATGNVGQNAYMWVGAKIVDGEWKWVETGGTVNNQLLPWDGAGAGECAALTLDSTLIKQDCSQMLKFICHRSIKIPLPCDYTTGWEDASDRCYKKSSQRNSWHDSEVECVIEGGHLTSIESDAEQMLAHDLALQVYDKVWIGYTEEDHPGTFTWVDGSNSNKTYWHEDQPDLSLNGFGAAVVDNDDPSGLWVVEKITNEFHYVCEKPVGTCLPGWEEFERSCYYFNTEDGDTVVWEDAKAICDSVQANMVVLDTDAEDTFFRTHMPEGDTLWIGLYSVSWDGMYWTDGSTMASKNYTHMTEEDESNAVNFEVKQCAYLQETLDTDGVTTVSSWVPTYCNEPRHYACEVEAGAEVTLIPPSNDRYCPEGWQQLAQQCYFFSTEEKTWTSAESDCQKRNIEAHLVSVITWSEQDFVMNNIEANAWIGLSDRDEIDTWKWIDGKALGIINWNSGEPNGDTEDCVEMYQDGGTWNDVPCSFLKTYSCKMAASNFPIGTVSTTTPIPDTSACGYDWVENTETGECYRIEFQELNFYDAQLHCNELYYYDGQSQPDLVSMYSVQEQNFVFGLLAAQHLSATAVWIGMINDIETNSWTDGTPSAYYNFNDGEPNDYFNEECIEMYTANGRWNDAYCSLRRPFICEKKGRNYVPLEPPPPPSLVCPSGWKSFNNKCYYFSTDKADWFTAEANCKSMLESDLVSITNYDENEFVYDELNNMWAIGWLGLRDDDNGENWHWTDGSLFDWTNWGSGEPNNANSGEHCGEMRADDYYWYGEWNDADCSDQNNYVCKIDVNTCPDSWVYNDGKCYYVSETEATRNEAQVKCKEMKAKADLVNIHSEEENQFFMGQLKQASPSCWMGLYYTGETWLWADNSSVEYTNWYNGEPNNLETELCAEMYDHPNDDFNGKWNNLPCSNSQAFGCELYPTHVVGCETSWEGFGDYCYFFSDKDDTIPMVTHDQAQEYCESVGANLASIHSAEENDFVYSLSSSYYDVFIGFTDIGHKDVFTWDDGTDVVFTAIDSFQYSSLERPEVCAVFQDYRGVWVLKDCDDLNDFLCKKPKQPLPINPDTHGCEEGDAYHGMSCYNLPGNSDTWDNAKADCESRGQHLAVLGNQYETAYFSALAAEAGHRLWIGLSGDIAADGSVTFTWVTGEALDYTYWDKYEPDPEHGTCVSASGSKDTPGFWATTRCSDTFEYACEYERVGYTTEPPPTTRPASDYCLYGWERKGLRCYTVMLDGAIWGDGEARCAKFGAHLASVGDEAEEQVLLTLNGMEEAVNQYGNVWVGLVMSSGSGYEWTDGSAAAYVNWAEGQPDSHEGRETCVSADATTFKLSDSVCLTHLPFICEAATGTMQSTATEPTKPPTKTCSDDTSWYLYNDHCYKFTSSVDEVGQTWWGAHRRCREEGGELASILSSDENYWIESMIYQHSKLSMWIGGRAKIGTGYEWLDGEPFMYDNWALGEPNNVNDQEDCIAMYTNNYGYWNDQNCGHTAGRICKRTHGMTHPPPVSTPAPDGHCPEGWIHTGTKCVYFMTDFQNFTVARKVCQKLGKKTDLASIHSAGEQAYLTAAMASLNRHMWLGMRYESGFVWVDQTRVSYTNWGPYEPNGGQGVEECVEVMSETGMWNDLSCSAELGAICMMTQDPSLPDHHSPNMCPEPHDAYTYYNGACYRAVVDPQNWEDAEATCSGENAHLVSIVSIAEDSFVWAVAQQIPLTSLWTGLNSKENIGTFVWSDGWPTVYTNWARDEPTLNLTRCVSMDVTDGAWYTKACDDSYQFICKYTNETVPTPDPPASGHCPDDRWKDFNGGYCYLFSNDTKTWDEGNRVCIQEMANLASIHSKEEMHLIKLTLDSYTTPSWIGLVEVAGGAEGWSDGTGVNYVNWETGEPNSGAEQCTEVMTHSGKWNDAPCDSQRYYVCKTKKIGDPTETPINPTTDGNGNGGGGGPDPDKPKEGISGGGIAGIVIAVLFVFAAAGFVGYTYVQKQAKGTKDPERPPQSFENIMYEEGTTSSGRTGGGAAGSMKMSGVIDGTDA